MANYHLVILKKPYLEAILDGRKTIESRFARTRHAPFGQVCNGDKLFLKVSSGPVCATATVSKVRNFQDLTPKQVIATNTGRAKQIAGLAFWSG